MLTEAESADLLEQLVRIPSVSRDETRAVRFLVERMERLGFDAHVDGAGNAVGTIGRDGPRIALVGHVDTVPGEVPVRRDAGRLYGRGSVDAKGSLAAFVVAAVRAWASGALPFRVQVVGCVEEEVPSSKGARHLVHDPPPDALVIGEPSGSRSITTGYKGFLRAVLTIEQELEHTAGDGTGAAARACRHFVHLESEAARVGGARACLYDRLLLHLDRVDTVADGLRERARLDLRLRLPEELPPEAAVAWLEERSQGWQVQIEGGLPAWSGPRTSPLARHLGRAITPTGSRATYLRKTGTADLNVLAPAWGCPAVAYGPGDSALDHTPNEHIELAEYTEATAVLERLLTSTRFAAELVERTSFASRA